MQIIVLECDSKDCNCKNVFIILLFALNISYVMLQLTNNQIMKSSFRI